MASNNPYNTYKSQQQAAEDPRMAEARALLRCAAALEEAQAEGTTYADYCNAIRLNQKLWTLFQATLMDESNQLPVHLKDILKNLSIYVDGRSLRAFAAHDPRALNVLISINKEIAAGLMESLKTAKPPEPVDAAGMTSHQA